MWWKNSVFYEIYIPGFKDSNGDGIGDIPGLIQELSYLKNLGVGALWLTPFYKSPMEDNGYDIEDYREINPLFGTMSDFERLTASAEKLGIRIVIDLVLNHTSTAHAWFRESESLVGNPKRDWYFWRKAPVNNWKSFFGGDAWQLNEKTGEYFYHAFAPTMADLNWDNAELRKEMYSVIRFWLERGVSGFRLDVINFLKAGIDWEQDNPVSDDGLQIHRYDMDAPGIAEVIFEIRNECKDFGDIMLMGEVGSEDVKVLSTYINGTQLDSVFSFNVASIKSKNFRLIGDELEKNSVCFPQAQTQTTLCFSTHDMSRFATRLCNGNREFIKAFLTLILTGPGIPMLYQGDELGIPDFIPEKIGDICDIKAIQHFYQNLFEGKTEEEAWACALAKSRDYSRALYLSSGRKKGIRTKTYIPHARHFGEILRKEQQNDPYSILEWTRTLIHLRSATPCLSEGSFSLIECSVDHIVYVRSLGKERWIVGINIGDKVISLVQEIEAMLQLESAFMDSFSTNVRTDKITKLSVGTTIHVRIDTEEYQIKEPF